MYKNQLERLIPMAEPVRVNIKPEEELMFTLTIGTFGTIASPKY